MDGHHDGPQDVETERASSYKISNRALRIAFVTEVAEM